jgi:XrtJ-associated TM-motif-TM protein
MKKWSALFPVLFLLMFVVSVPLHAQTGITDGCTDSPENPTAVLALVGIAGALGAGLKNRLAGRRLRGKTEEIKREFSKN